MARQLQKPTGRGTPFSGTEGKFLLPHHPNELERLKTMAGLMQSDTDNVLIKTPLPPTGSSIRILDSGCADATWLHELSKGLPQYKWSLHGIDIHKGFFADEFRAPVHLDLRKHDINLPVPTAWNWKETFDIVHQRLLIWGIETLHWPGAIQNLLHVLKPGGWIQLVEVVWIDRAIPHEHVELKKLRLLETWTCDNHDFDIHVAEKLEGLLKDAGCENVQKYEFDFGMGAKAKKDEWRKRSADMWNETFRSFEHKMPMEGIQGVAKTPEELHQFLDKLDIEVRKYGYMPKINFVIGQKPKREKGGSRGCTGWLRSFWRGD